MTLIASSYNYWVWRAQTPVGPHLEEFQGRLQAEIDHNLLLPNEFHHRDGDLATSLDIEYT